MAILWPYYGLLWLLYAIMAYYGHIMARNGYINHGMPWPGLAPQPSLQPPRLLSEPPQAPRSSRRPIPAPKPCRKASEMSRGGPPFRLRRLKVQVFRHHLPLALPPPAQAPLRDGAAPGLGLGAVGDLEVEASRRQHQGDPHPAGLPGVARAALHVPQVQGAHAQGRGRVEAQEPALRHRGTPSKTLGNLSKSQSKTIQKPSKPMKNTSIVGLRTSTEAPSRRASKRSGACSRSAKSSRSTSTLLPTCHLIMSPI